MFALATLSGTNIGYRHILVVPAFLTVATGALAGLRVRGRRIVVAAVALVFLAGVSTWRVYPFYLAYGSELFGGPDKGYRLIAGSNLDWGQDLGRAARYVRDKHPGEPIYLLYFGTRVPMDWTRSISPRFPAGTWRTFTGSCLPRPPAWPCTTIPGSTSSAGAHPPAQPPRLPSRRPLDHPPTDFRRRPPRSPSLASTNAAASRIAVSI